MKKFAKRKIFMVLVGLVGIGLGALTTRHVWQPWVEAFAWPTSAMPSDGQHQEANKHDPNHDHHHDHDHEHEEDQGQSVILTDQAIINLGVKSTPVTVGSYWRSITIPGQIVERPGHSDHRITSPVEGVVSRIYVHPGDTVRPGDSLFQIRLTSESVHQTQTEYYLKTQEQNLLEQQRQRLRAAGDAIPKERLIEIDNQMARLEAGLAALRRDLLWRGLTDEQIAEVAQGRFVSEIVIQSPQSWIRHHAPSNDAPVKPLAHQTELGDPIGEVQELTVELGERVQSGQSLCLLAHHHALAIEGRAFADEAPLLQRAVQMGWPIAVDFLEPETTGWSHKPESFHIRHIANTVDPIYRTISFWVPLENESQRVDVNGRSLILWRFRPGQRVRIRVPIERLHPVHVLPISACVRDGVETYVFIQNVNRFIRLPVRVLTQDRENVVIANDGTLLPGMYVVENGAARLNRAIKSASSGAPPGYHVHADGSLHKNSDEGK